MQIERWAEDLQQEVYQFWKDNFNDWDPGFKVFYGPVSELDDILILGYQPGGMGSGFEEKCDTYESGDFSLPQKHEYLETDWPIAREMRSLFGNNEDVISRSIKTNVIFFRSPNMDYWTKHMPKESREEIQSYCISRVRELIVKAQPNVIIAEGIATWDAISGSLDLETDYCKNRGNSRLVCTSLESSPKVIGLMHPSGARISKKHKQVMKSELLKILSENTKYNIEIQ